MSADEDCPLFRKKPKEVSPAQQLANESLFKKKNPLTEIWRFGNRPISPFIRVRDLNNPAGDNDGRHAVTAVEAGIKISF